MKNIYLIYSLDQKMINIEIDKLVKKINIPHIDIVKISLAEKSILNLIEEASIKSMFSPKKIIIVEDSVIFNVTENVKNIEELLKYLKNYNPDTYIIFTLISDKIDNRKKITKLIKEYDGIIELNNKNNSFLTKYIKDSLNNYKITADSIEYFIKRAGTNLDNIDNELEKLKMYKISELEITKDDIKLLTVENLDDAIYMLNDAVIKNSKDESLKLFNEFLEKGYDELAILSLLGNYFTLLYQIKRLNNKGNSNDEIAKILNIHPYRVKLILNSLDNYLESDLAKYLLTLADFDRNIKTGKIDKRIALELFIVNKDKTINIQ